MTMQLDTSTTILPAMEGRGVALMLVNSKGQLLTFIPFEEDDEQLSADATASHILLAVTRWLAENRYITAADGHGFVCKSMP